MPAPAPYDYVAGRPSIKTQAVQLVGQYGWIYRWSDEYTKDVRANLKKVAQLAKHCVMFRAIIDAFKNGGAVAPGSPIVNVAEAAFADNNVRWPDQTTTIADLTAIYQAAGNFLTVINTMPAPRIFAHRAYDANWNEIEVDEIIDKTADLTNAIAALRAAFD